MRRIAVAEDDSAQMRQLQDYISRYAAEHGEEIAVDPFPDGAELLFQYRPIYDVLLLDIEMPHVDGMKAARAIRQQDNEVVIIFITNMAKYAIRGYEVHALDFVLKPISYSAFSIKLGKAFSMLDSRLQSAILISTADGVRKLAVADITYLEVVDHRLMVHTISGAYSASGTLNTMEEKLKGQNFARCNKGYLVNLRHVSLIRTDTVVVGGDELLISRRRKEDFRRALMDYYGGSRV